MIVIQQQLNLAGLAENPSQPVNHKRQSATQKRPGLHELQRLLCEDKRRPNIKKGGRKWITCAGILKGGWSVWHRKEKEFVPNAGDKHLMIVALYSQGYGPQRIEEMTGVKKSICRYVIQGFGLDTPDRIAANRKKAGIECKGLEAKEGLTKEERDTYWKAVMRDVHSHKRQQARYEGLYVDHSEWGEIKAARARVEAMRKYYENHEQSKRKSAKNARAQWKKHSKLKSNYFIANRIRSRVYGVLKGINKSAPTLALLGNSLEGVRAHLEQQFTEGMGWHNYGAWHIDHIRPCASFDLSKPEQQRQCFHYTNLQPLWASENISKGSKWKGERARRRDQ